MSVTQYLLIFFGVVFLFVFNSCDGPNLTTVTQVSIPECDPNSFSQADLPTDFDIFDTSASGYSDLQSYFSNLRSINQSFSEENIEFLYIDSGIDKKDKFRGGVLSRNNLIFMYPQTFSVTDIHVFNPENDKLCRVKPSESLSGVWAGGTSLPDGRIISFPIVGNQILEIDPYNVTVSVVATTNGTYGGQILASNGMLYGVPYGADHVLKFDPNTFSQTKLGSFPSGGSKWYSSALGANGKIYGIPLDAEQVIEIDPSDDSVNLIGDIYPGDLKWAGSVFAMNDKIYGIPDDAAQVLEISPTSQGTRLIGSLGNESQKWSFGFLGPDAKVYMCPDSGDTILQFDPATDEINFLGQFTGPDKWNGVVQAKGDFYAIPDSSPYLLKINFNAKEDVASFIQLSPFFNKY